MSVRRNHAENTKSALLYAFPNTYTIFLIASTTRKIIKDFFSLSTSAHFFHPFFFFFVQSPQYHNATKFIEYMIMTHNRIEMLKFISRRKMTYYRINDIQIELMLPNFREKSINQSIKNTKKNFPHLISI